MKAPVTCDRRPGRAAALGACSLWVPLSRSGKRPLPATRISRVKEGSGIKQGRCNGYKRLTGPIPVTSAAVGSPACHCVATAASPPPVGSPALPPTARPSPGQRPRNACTATRPRTSTCRLARPAAGVQAGGRAGERPLRAQVPAGLPGPRLHLTRGRAPGHVSGCVKRRAGTRGVHCRGHSESVGAGWRGGPAGDRRRRRQRGRRRTRKLVGHARSGAPGARSGCRVTARVSCRVTARVSYRVTARVGDSARQFRQQARSGVPGRACRAQ